MPFSKYNIVYDTKKSLENDIGPEKSIMINRRRILHRFKSSQNAPLGNLFVFNLSQQFKLPNIISNSALMHRLASLISKVSQQFHLPKHRL